MAKNDDARRVAALCKKPVRPKFQLGALVVDRHGEEGAIEAAYVDLAAAEGSGVIENAARWLAVQEKRPKTSVKGVWYAVVCKSGGQVLVGEKDLKLAGRGAG